MGWSLAFLTRATTTELAVHRRGEAPGSWPSFGSQAQRGCRRFESQLAGRYDSD